MFVHDVSIKWRFLIPDAVMYPYTIKQHHHAKPMDAECFPKFFPGVSSHIITSIWSRQIMRGWVKWKL
jgi:hypothetical protein